MVSPVRPLAPEPRGFAVKGPLEVGEPVTILPPWDRDPVLVAMQHYGNVAEARPLRLGGHHYMVRLGATAAGLVFGPFPADRLVPGWRDRYGRWWVG